MEEKENMVDVEVREQISNLVQAIEHSGDEEEQLRTVLTVSTILVIRFTDSSYAAIGAFEVMKKGIMMMGKELYSQGEERKNE